MNKNEDTRETAAGVGVTTFPGMKKKKMGRGFVVCSLCVGRGGGQSRGGGTARKKKTGVWLREGELPSPMRLPMQRLQVIDGRGVKTQFLNW